MCGLLINLSLDAKYRPIAEEGSAAGMSNATTGSPTDMLTRQHRMTVDEAMLILNLKRGETSSERVLQVRSLLYFFLTACEWLLT